jgi:hypothetical protein
VPEDLGYVVEYIFLDSIGGITKGVTAGKSGAVALIKKSEAYSFDVVAVAYNSVVSVGKYNENIVCLKRFDFTLTFQGHFARFDKIGFV